MKAWLKGGLWGLIASILILFIGFKETRNGIVLAPICRLFIKTNCTYEACIGPSLLCLGLLLILVPILCILAGAIIGAIIGKIKSRNQN